MATQTEINFTELIDLSLGTPEVVNYKGLRVLLAAIVSKLGVSALSVNVELNEGDKKELRAVKEAYTKESKARETTTAKEPEPKAKPKPKGKDEADTGHIAARPATGTGAGRQETTMTNDMDKSKSITVTDAVRLSSGDSVPKVLQNMEEKMSRIEGQLNVLNALPSNQSLMAKSGTSEDGSRTTPVSDMWQLMQCQRKATANEEGVSKLMSMVEDIMRELRNMNEKLQEHSSNFSDLQNKHGSLQKDIDKINEYNKTVESRLSTLEMSSGQQDKIDDLQKLLDSLRNQLASMPAVEEIVTWPDFEAALKGAYKEPIDHLDSGMQTAPMVDHSRMQTMPLHDAFAQTNTPSPPASRPVSSRSVRSALSAASSHPTQEIQRVLRDLGELMGRHNLLEDRVKGLEELLAKKADMSAVEALLSQWNVPDDLAKKLAELEDGLHHLRDSKSKLADIEERLRTQSEHCPASLEDIATLRQEMEQAIADLAEAQDALARDVSQIGLAEGEEQGATPTAMPSSMMQGEPQRGRSMHSGLIEELEHRLQSSLQGLSSSMQKQLSQAGSRISSLEKSLRDQLRELGQRVEARPSRVRSLPRAEGVTLPPLDSQSLADLQNTLLQLQAEVDKLNASYVHLVDEHNVKQKHIDALYTFVDRLQENKADKEHVIMEIDVKADKRALDNKVSRSHFDGTVDELSKNLSDVMEKMTGHRVAWDDAVSELKLDIDNKLDRMELDPLKAYLDNRIKSVNAKVVRKEVETGEDAAGFRKPLQKFHCISCDRPLDMAPHSPIASLPENKGMPGNRTGRPYTTFELEQIRAAQKNERPGRNVQHYQRALFRQELARRRRQEILAYLVHFDGRVGGHTLGPSLEHRVKPGAIPPIKNLQHQHTYGYKLVEGGNYQDVPDYFVANRSCGGSHTLTFPHRRITRTSQMTNTVTTTEEIAPVVNGRVEADIQGQDGHIYKARLDTGVMTERLPTLTHPKMSTRVKSPRVSSARSRRSHPPTRQSAEPVDNGPSLLPTGAPLPRPTSARGGGNQRPSSAKPPSPENSVGRRSPPMTAPDNMVEETGISGNGGPPPSPMPPRNTQVDPITVPHPPTDPDQS